MGGGWEWEGDSVAPGQRRDGKNSWSLIAESPGGLCVSYLFPRCYPYSTTSTDGELGRGLPRLWILLLEFSFELGRRERQEEPGRQKEESWGGGKKR